MPTFESPCPDCWEPVTYSNGRAANHDCAANNTTKEQDQ